MSKIEVNTIEPQCGTTLTLGANNDKITLGTGASFGGGVAAIQWETTPQTGDFSALSGRGYFVDSSSAARTVTLPASPSAGDIVAVSDYAQTSGTNSITIARNGSNIQGDASDLVIQRNGIAMTLIFVDSTKGWIVIDTGREADKEAEPAFISASGGTITTCGDDRIHTFTGPGTFTVCSVGNPIGSTTVDYLVVAAGAGGGWGGGNGGGGGAGGMRFSFPNPGTGGLPVTAQGYPITIGAGGTGGTGPTVPGVSGGNSIFSSITSSGGGGGGSDDNHPVGKLGSAGGSGGGAGGGGGGPGVQPGGAGNTPPVSPPQGNPGGTVSPPGLIGGTGGGGHSAAGGNVCGPQTPGGTGGAGSPLTISGSNTTYAGGGGGGADTGGTGGSGGAGGGGNGGNNNGNSCMTDGTANTGGGGGGNGGPFIGASGGSGIVIIRYKFQ